jgi:hypothetical protein
VEQGTQAELMARQGQFYRLAQLQSVVQEPAMMQTGENI